MVIIGIETNENKSIITKTQPFHFQAFYSSLLYSLIDFTLGKF